MCTMRYVRDVADAEDIVQDVLTAFWHNKQGRPFNGSPCAYLFAAVSRAAMKHVSRKRTVCVGDVEKHMGRRYDRLIEYAEDEREALCMQLEAGINRLPHRSREIFNMIVTTNLSYAQIGAALGISVNTVKTLYYNGLKKLRENAGDDKTLIM